jgi:hypothetical protein
MTLYHTQLGGRFRVGVALDEAFEFLRSMFFCPTLSQLPLVPLLAGPFGQLC